MYTGLNQNYFSTWKKQVEIFQTDENHKSGWLSLPSQERQTLYPLLCGLHSRLYSKLLWNI